MLTPLKLGLIADPPALVLIYKTKTGDNSDGKSKKRKRKIPLRNFSDTTNVIKYIQVIVRARHAPFLETVHDTVIQKLLRIIQLVQKGYTIEAAVARTTEELGLSLSSRKPENKENQSEDATPLEPEIKSVPRGWTAEPESDTNQNSPNLSGHSKVSLEKHEESRANRYLVGAADENSSEEQDLEVKSVSFSISLKKDNQFTSISIAPSKEVEEPQRSIEDPEFSDAGHIKYNEVIQPQIVQEPNYQEQQETAEGNDESEESSGESEDSDDYENAPKIKFTSIFQPPTSRLAKLKSLRPATSAAPEQSKDDPPKINIKQLVSNAVRSSSVNKKTAAEHFADKGNKVLQFKTGAPVSKLSPPFLPFSGSEPFKANDQLPPPKKFDSIFSSGARIMNSQSIDSNQEENGSGSDKSDSGEEQEPEPTAPPQFDIGAISVTEETEDDKLAEANVAEVKHSDIVEEVSDTKLNEGEFFFSKSKQPEEKEIKPLELDFETYKKDDLKEEELDDDFW